MSLVADAGPDYSSGSMVALYPDPQAAKQLAVQDGLPPDRLHLTVLYLGPDGKLGGADPAEVKQALADIATHSTPLAGQVGGVGRFVPEGDDPQPVYASVDAQGLSALRQAVERQLTALGVTYPTDHDFTPHITLTYLPDGQDEPDVTNKLPLPVRFGGLSLTHGTERTDFPFGHPFDPVAVELEIGPPEGEDYESLADSTEQGTEPDWLDELVAEIEAGALADEDGDPVCATCALPEAEGAHVDPGTGVVLAAGVCTGPGPCDVAPLGEGKNWVTEVGGLPVYIRAIAHALIRKGRDKTTAIKFALGTIKRWAAGGGGVSAKTQARAAAALADWERKRAQAHATAGSGAPAEGADPVVYLPQSADPRALAGEPVSAIPVLISVPDGTRRKAKLRKSKQQSADDEEQDMTTTADSFVIPALGEFDLGMLALSADELDAFGDDIEQFAIGVDERRKAAKAGTAMKDGSYPIRNANELESAVRVFPQGAGKFGKTKDEIKAHIVKRAKALKIADKLPDSWQDGEDKAVAAAALLAAAVTEAEPAEVPEFAGEGPRFRIPMVLPTSIESGDRRSFKQGSLDVRELPIPLYWQTMTDDGHKRSVIVGRIDSVEKTDKGLANGRGVFDIGEHAQEAVRLVRGKFLRGVSGDVDQAEAELSEQDGQKPKVEFGHARLTAATLVGKPAFEECKIELEEPSQEEAVAASGQRKTEQIAALVAAGGPLAPPASWFENPNLEQPTRLKVTDDGQVFGHIATWDTLHIGMPFTRPPKSKSGYSYFRTGELVTAEGETVPVGQLTLVGGHADLTASAAEAVRHYDDTNSAVADLAVGEDRHGIWVAGALRPGLSDEQMRAIRASAPSGDWRPIGSNLELVGICQVNVPGFPVPQARVASGQVQALVAAGALPILLPHELSDQDAAAERAALRAEVTASARQEARNAVRETMREQAAELATAALTDASGQPLALDPPAPRPPYEAYPDRVSAELAKDPNVGGGVDRDKLKASDFVFGDERAFPVVTPGDVQDAASSWGRYRGSKSYEQFKRRLTALAKRKGDSFVRKLPDSWGVTAAAPPSHSDEFVDDGSVWDDSLVGGGAGPKV